MIFMVITILLKEVLTVAGIGECVLFFVYVCRLTVKESHEKDHCQHSVSPSLSM